MAGNIDELERFFRELSKKMQDITPVAEELGQIGTDSISENFRQGGRFGDGPFGGGSQAWKPSIRVQVKGGTTLSDKGLLAASVRYELEGNGVIAFLAGPRPGAAALNFGAEISAHPGGYLWFRPYPGGPLVHKQSVALPERPYMVLQDEDIDDMIQVLADYLAWLASGGG